MLNSIVIEQYFQGQLELIIKLFIAAILGFITAWDRKKFGKGAGMRTYGLISMGACLFTIASQSFINDPARIAASIVTGVGFIGAGIIWERRGNIIGVTTAAGVWVSAAIGLAVALNLWLVAIATTFIVMLLFNTRRVLPWS